MQSWCERGDPLPHVLLDDDDCTLARRIAYQRVDTQMQAGYYPSAHTYDGTSHRTRVRTEPREKLFDKFYPSVIAELAAAIALNGSIDQSLVARGSKRGNVILPDKRRGNAKLEARDKDYALKSTDPDDFHGQFGFLVWIVPYTKRREYRIAGYVSRETFRSEARISDLFYQGNRLVYPYYKLRSITELVDREWEMRDAPDAAPVVEAAELPVQGSLF